MKAYNKGKLAYENGYIMKGNKVIAVDPDVVGLFNKLDYDRQKAEFDRGRATATFVVEEVMAEEFVPMTERAIMTFNVKTPNLDTAIDNSMKIMDELDACANARLAEEYLDAIDPVVQFVASDKVISTNCQPLQFDLPTIGNPLEMTIDDLFTIVQEIFKD